MRKQWLKAKADITLALQNDKTKDSCETWYLAGIIDFGISRDSVLRRDYPDAMRSSFEAFRKAQSISSDQYNRLVIANSGATNPVRAIGALYFESAVNEFNRKNFLEALRNFQRSLAVNRYLVELRDPNVPLFDTSLVLNAGIAADAYYKQDTVEHRVYLDSAMYYYTQIVDRKIVRPSFEGVYLNVVYTYYRLSPNREKLKKYLYIAKRLFPQSSKFMEIEAEMKFEELQDKNSSVQERFEVYETALAEAQGQARNRFLQSYITELQQYVHPRQKIIRPDYQERADRLEELYAELLGEFPDNPDFRYNYGVHFYEEFEKLKIEVTPLRKTLNDLRNDSVFRLRAYNKEKNPGAKHRIKKERIDISANIKATLQSIERLRKEQNNTIDKIVEQWSVCEKQFLAKKKTGKLSGHEKNMLKSIASALIDLYMFRHDKAQVEHYTALYDAL